MSHVDIRFTDKNSERFMLARRVYKVIEDLENEYLYPCLLYTSDAADE